MEMIIKAENVLYSKLKFCESIEIEMYLNKSNICRLYICNMVHPKPKSS